MRKIDRVKSKSTRRTSASPSSAACHKARSFAPPRVRLRRCVCTRDSRTVELTVCRRRSPPIWLTPCQARQLPRRRIGEWNRSTLTRVGGGARCGGRPKLPRNGNHLAIVSGNCHRVAECSVEAGPLRNSTQLGIRWAVSRESRSRLSRRRSAASWMSRHEISKRSPARRKAGDVQLKKDFMLVALRWGSVARDNRILRRVYAAVQQSWGDTARRHHWI
jgi:hypothetical protein